MVKHPVLTWIRIHANLLALCSIAAALIVLHRFMNGNSGQIFAHTLSDSHIDSVFLLRRAEVIPEKPSTKIADIHPPHQNQGESTSQLRVEAAVAPIPGCVVDLPDPDLRKHIVPPPPGPVTLVCCNTTAGPLSLEVHPSWAPRGAAFFLKMVDEDFFSSQVPLFRALKGFLVQFGLSGNTTVQARYHRSGLIDDPPWLPLGPPGREIRGITRYQKGYLSYAGAGKNSRGTQLILALADNKYLGGGSPWEVPIGQAVGEESMRTIDRIYTGYGEKVSQGKIMNRGISYIRSEFPKVDIIHSCVVTRRNVPWTWIPTETNTNVNAAPPFPPPEQ